MLSEDVIEKLSERLVNRIEEANLTILKLIGERIKQIGFLNYSQARQLQQILLYGGDYNKIVKQIAEITDLNVRDIDKIFQEVAKTNQEFAKQFYKYRNVPFIPFDDNSILKNQVDALAEITKNEYLNLSQTSALGYLVKDAKGKLIFRSLDNVYRDAIDKAVLNIAQGKSSFDTEMYNFLKSIGESGLRYVEYESGRTMRLDSAVRMNMKGALTNLSMELQKTFGKEFNSDGVEISVHLKPAPDHAEVQGHQFTNDEFNKFQNDQDSKSVDGTFYPAEHDGHDRRSIGQYNCYHYVFAIVVGVSQPLYNNEELKKIIDDNNKGFELDGKHYTLYEGTQMQRQLETKIREQKDVHILGKASGKDKLVNESQRRINILINRYNELSQKSGLKTRKDRLRVSGYHRTKVK